MRDETASERGERIEKAGGFAFPVSDRMGTQFGMTLRDYFAARALTGLITVTNGDIISTNDLAKQAYRTADAMLREREVDVK